ncbi:hypothetical protein [Methylocystis echinoides]|jgi:hypothetical protein|uniref:hypothetical protein n=1 Tax=Methylocystis echinoides TaxID=29468 RepID=UPI00343AE752
MTGPLRIFAGVMLAALLLADAAAYAVPLAAPPATGPAATLARGGFYGGVGRPVAGYRGGYYRPGGYYRGGYYAGWRRPAYGWAPGGAIAAGAAIGVLSAAAAASYATSAAPADGLCWFYTDATYSAGFWDACP